MFFTEEIDMAQAPIHPQSTFSHIFVMVFHTIISWFSSLVGALFPNDSAGIITTQAPTTQRSITPAPIMTCEPTIPLLSLPDNEIIRKLREMKLEEILKFSLISERSKNLVKSIQIKSTSLTVSVHNEISICMEIASKVLRLRYYLEPDMYWGMGAYGRKKRLTAPQSALVDVMHLDGESEEIDDFEEFLKNSELEKRDFTMQNWLDHLQQIFDYAKVDHLTFTSNSPEFDIDDIEKLFRNTPHVLIGDTGCFAFNQLVLQKFSPIETLEIGTSDFQNFKIPDNIFMENFTELHIREREEETKTSMKLNDMLLINSKEIGIGSFHMSAQQLNKFLKLWMKGSNPNMEYLAIYYYGENELDNEIIMKGIKHRVVGGGIDVVRMDGVKATIQFSNSHSLPTVEMIVWFDHCVEES
ncbi:unnamed protein product [Caenorhabditis brenneri]